jgi:hypothetical protein
MSYKLKRRNSVSSTISGHNPYKNSGDQNMIQQKQFYENKDFYLSAFLMASGLDLVEHRRQGPISVFRFIKNNELINLVDQYYTDSGWVKPMRYSTYIRTLKSILHNALSESKSENYYVKQNQKGNLSRG